MVVGASPKTAMEVVKGKDLSGKTAVVTGGNSGDLLFVYQKSANAFAMLRITFCNISLPSRPSISASSCSNCSSNLNPGEAL